MFILYQTCVGDDVVFLEKMDVEDDADLIKGKINKVLAYGLVLTTKQI